MVTSDSASALSWFNRVCYFGARLMVTTLMACIIATYWPKIKKKPPNNGMMPLTNNAVAGHKAVLKHAQSRCFAASKAIGQHGASGLRRFTAALTGCRTLVARNPLRRL